jgi:hypothetical protein
LPEKEYYMRGKYDLVVTAKAKLVTEKLLPPAPN